MIILFVMFDYVVIVIVVVFIIVIVLVILFSSINSMVNSKQTCFFFQILSIGDQEIRKLTRLECVRALKGTL